MCANNGKCLAEVALEWCSRNPGWVRICDISGEEYEAHVRIRWKDIDAATQSAWRKRYGSESAQQAWEEFAITPGYRVPAGGVTAQGEFLTLDAYRAAMGVGAMMVFRIDSKPRGGAK